VGWTWAEVTGLIVTHILGVRPGLDRLHLRPWLPVGLDRIEGSFMIRGMQLHVVVTRTTQEPSALVNGASRSLEDGAIALPYVPDQAMEVEIRL
jgi:cellobiose phosphorylase